MLFYNVLDLHCENMKRFVPTPDRRQSKTLILLTNIDQKLLDWRQMAIENTVSINF